MDDRTKNLIKIVFETNNVKLRDDDRTELERINYEHGATVEMLMDHYACDSLRAEMIANSVDSKKEPTMIGPAPRSPGNSFGNKAKSYANRWTAVVAGFVVVMIAILWTKCSLHMPVSSNDTVSQSDFDSLETKVNELKTDHGRVDELEKGMKELVGEDGVISTIAGDVDELKKKVGNLETNKVDKTDLDKKLKEKASQSDLDKVRKRLRRVEKKLDAHIADDDEIIIPVNVEEPSRTDLPAGTTSLTIEKVLVDD